MPHIVIVGAGFAGLGMGIRLKQAGLDDFVILERASGVGGTWRDNVYPGAGCDVESHLYSFSFEPYPKWTRTFAPQPEILSYLEHCTDKYGLRPHIRFDSSVSRARYDEGSSSWEIATTSSRETLRADILVSACGGLSREKLPDIPGLSTFEGKMFHSARWDRTASLRGKRVAVIGTGASSIQIVPAIASEVDRLFVFQRTPPWILPKPDVPIPESLRTLYARLPVAQRLRRQAIYWQRELMALGMVVDPRIMRLPEAIARRYLEKSVADPELRRKLSPSYTLGCKRVLPTNDWYEAIQRENVDLVTEPIAEVRAGGVVTRDGVLHEVDTVILATGFQASEQVAPFEVEGRAGRDLARTWDDGAEAYLGTTVTGFPNLFFLVGPNTGLGHTSMIVMIEAQIAYVLDALRTMRRKGLRSVEVRGEAQRRYNEEIGRRLKRTVWSSGCMSWYLTSTGKNTTLFPGFTFEYVLRTRRFDVRAYHVEDGVEPLGAQAPHADSVAQAPAMTTSSRSLTFT
jgi:cation diffusion facilitator CzcD-associated flavoprotein CzcO